MQVETPPPGTAAAAATAAAQPPRWRQRPPSPLRPPQQAPLDPSAVGGGGGARRSDSSADGRPDGRRRPAAAPPPPPPPPEPLGGARPAITACATRRSGAAGAAGGARIGRGGRILFDRAGGSKRNYKHPCWPPLLEHAMRTGRMGAPVEFAKLLEPQPNPDEAWRQNRPLKIKQGPKLFDFAWIPKPDLLPPQGGSGAGPSAPNGTSEESRKRKEPDTPANGP